jgi:hypothetical protein
MALWSLSQCLHHQYFVDLIFLSPCSTVVNKCLDIMRYVCVLVFLCPFCEWTKNDVHACMSPQCKLFFLYSFVRKQLKAHVLFAIPTLTTIHDLKLLTTYHVIIITTFQSFKQSINIQQCGESTNVFQKWVSLNLIKCYHRHFIQATRSSTVRETEGTSVVELRP